MWKLGLRPTKQFTEKEYIYGIFLAVYRLLESYSVYR
jgi:hypothetical protein